MLVRITAIVFTKCEKYPDSVCMLVKYIDSVLHACERLFTHRNLNIKLPGIFLSTREIRL